MSLIRGIGRWSLVALVINGVIGAGIFGLPAKVHALAGTYSLFAFVVCAIFIALLVVCFAEVSSRFTHTGGPYLYARAAFGSFTGFQIGWLMWLTRLTGFAALCNLLIGYLGYFAPSVAASGWRAAAVTAIVSLLTFVNIIGIRPTAWVSNFFTIGKLVPLILFVAVGAFFVDPQQYSFATPPDASSFSTAVLLLVFAFTGFEVALIPAGEVRDPRRHMPFALLFAIGVATLLYVLIQWVSIGTLPELANSQRPLAEAAERFLGAAGASIVTAGALISIVGTLNTGVLAAPRLLFAMAEQGQLPRLFAATHSRFSTPYVAILISAAVMLVLSLNATFIAALTISTVIRLITYAATCVALIKLRRNDNVAPATFVVSGGPWIAVAATVLSVWLLINSARSEVILVGVAAVLGALLYVVGRFVVRSGR